MILGIAAIIKDCKSDHTNYTTLIQHKHIYIYFLRFTKKKKKKKSIPLFGRYTRQFDH
ncbi:hypothetical protein HanXRQr2_Chr04g0154621 [Helianthus annuus]|uniref:Uncharacterized protein n=1 Tax=Helianthus annuus TaxID=4232 RepID=A0A9K3NRH6_HELAN|nr:hypothetical protein HanXRQr2_Chr04g0154621 [Helianthus annuus]